jgi:hypothetical protein
VTAPLSPQVGELSFCQNCHVEVYYGPFPADHPLQQAGVIDHYFDAVVWRHLDGWTTCPSRGGQIAAPGAPEIVCLCGSTRFYAEFQQANYDLTMQSCIVLTVGFYPQASDVHGHGEGVGHDSVEKVQLDELHKRKIDLANRVLVLNVGGYIGESTRSEIDYAEAHGVRVDYLEPLS